jgi:hypothetical protein
LFGSVLLTSKTSAINLGKTLMSLVGGASSANYLTPIVMETLKLDSSKYKYGIAFILGFLGLKGIEFFSQKFFPDIPTEPEKPVKAETPVKKPKKKTTKIEK